MGTEQNQMAEAALPVVEVAKIGISPNECAISSELKLDIEFSVDKPLSSAVWDLKYIVDYTNKRKERALGKVEIGSYPAGEVHRLCFEVPEIDVSGIKESLLLNVGLVLAVLSEGDVEVVQISMVTQVTRNDSGELQRNIFNPLE